MKYYHNIYIFVFSIIFSFSLYAQDSVPSNLSSTIEEIVVTARGKEESVRDIPVAITVLSQERLENLSITTFEDISATTPGLDIIRSVSGSGAVINIRGIASNGNSIGIAQSVATIMDGVYYENGRVINEGTFDVKQVAILKGPQALYFGKNATAGALTFETNNPTDEFEAYAKIGYEIEEERKAFEGVLSGPISDDFGARLAIRTTEADDGLISNKATAKTITPFDIGAGGPGGPFDVPAPSENYWPGQESTYVRLTLDWAVSENINLNLKISQTEYETNSPSGVRERGVCPSLNGVAQGGFVDGVPQPAAGVECRGDWSSSENPLPTAYAASHSRMGRFGGALGEDFEATNITLKADISLESFDIVAYLNTHENETNWVGDFDAGGAPGVWASENNTFDSTSLEVRLNSKFDGAVNFVAGLYLQESERWFGQDVFVGSVMNSNARDVGYIPGSYKFMLYDKASETDGETTSYYFEVIGDVSDQTQITAGIRYIEEEKDSYFKQPYVWPGLVGRWTPESVNIITADQEWDDTVGEITVRHELNENVTIYAGYKEGWKSGGFSNSGILGVASGSTSDFTFEPEKVDGFELGLKGIFLDGTLNLDAEIFSYQFEGLQVDFFNAVVWSNITYNAGTSETDGAEINVVWNPANIEGLTLSGSVLFLDSAYKNFVAPCFAGMKPADGCDIFIPGTVPQQQLGGTDRVLAPEVSGFAGLDYERPLDNGLTVGATINLQFKDDYSFSEFGHPNANQKGYELLDAGLRIGDQDGRWSLALIGKNITEEYAILFSRDAPSTGTGTGTPQGVLADLQVTPIQGRTFEVVFTYKY